MNWKLEYLPEAEKDLKDLDGSQRILVLKAIKKVQQNPLPVEEQGYGKPLGFLSFLVATAAAQTVNFFVQKNLVFKSNAAFEKAVPKYIVLAVVLVLVSAALPAYSQSFFVNIGISEALAPTLANVLNILVQVVLSYPTMKFWIMPNK